MNDHDKPDAAPRFSPGRFNAVWGLLCALGSAYLMSLRRPANGSAQAFGEAFGAFFGIFLYASALGWLVWRVRGRRERGGQTTFALVCTALLLGQVSAHGVRVFRDREVQAVQTVALEHTAKLLAAAEREPPITTADVAGELVRLDALFDTMEPRFRDRRFAVTMRQQAAHVAAFELAFAGAAGDFNAANVVDWTGLERDGDIARRRVACEDYLAANKVYREALADNMRIFRARVEQAQLGELSAPLLQAAEQKTAQMRPAIEAFTTASETMANATIALLDHLDRDRARWSVGPDATLAFETDADAAAAQRHLSVVNASANVVLDTIKQVDGVR